LSCFSPIKGFRTSSGVVFSELRRHDIIGDIEIPCGQCVGCRMRRAGDWATRCMHEASLWESNCFVTLTYARDALPPDGSLCYRDFQLFLKRLRKKGNVRFYMCGEYGPVNLRPHYHACLFNVDFRSDRVMAGKSGSGFAFYESAELTALWGHGKCTVQDLTRQTAGYCARYIMKKQLGTGSPFFSEEVDEDGVIHTRVAEFSRMSLKPGIGAGWFKKYNSDVYRHDYVVVDGSKQRPPRYYDKLYDRIGGVEVDAIEFQRELDARKSASDNTPERRAVREAVFKAKISSLKRSL